MATEYSEEQLAQMPEAAREAYLRNKAALQAQPEASGQPAVTHPAAVQVSQTPPAVTPLVAPLVAPAAAPLDAEARQRAIDQKFGQLGQQLQVMQAELAARDKLIADMTKVRTETPPPTPAADAEITTEVLVATYGQQFVDQVGEDQSRVMLKAMRAEAKRYAAPPATNVEKVVKDQLSEYERQAEARRLNEAFKDRVEALAPGGLAINAAAETNGFGNWLNQQFPGRGTQTYRQAAEIAWQNRDAMALSDIFKMFAQPGFMTPQAPQPPPMESQVIPGIGAGIPPATSGQPQKVSRKAYMLALEIFRTQPGKYTAAEQQGIHQEYNRAVDMGLVVNDV